MHKITYHRDKTITVWNVFTQNWQRTAKPSDAFLSTLSEKDRRRVCRHCGIE